jgi:zinc transporter ZupT
VSDATLGKLLAFYCGFFLYMGATDLLPEAHEHSSWGRVALTLTGFGAIFGISLLTG